MAVRNRTLAWLQASVAMLALIGTLLLQPVATSMAQENTPEPSPAPATATAAPASTASAAPASTATAAPESAPASSSVAAEPTTPSAASEPAQQAAVEPSVEASEPAGQMTAAAADGTLFTSASGSFQVRGAFLSSYQAAGGQQGMLGSPIGEERAVAHGGTRQDFQNGSLWWSPSTGVQMTAFGLHSAYAANGFEAGSLGFPISGEWNSNGGALQEFQNGTLWYKNGRVFVTKFGFNQYVAANGLEMGSLGFPTSDEKPAKDGGTTQTFERGQLWWHWSAGGVQKVQWGFLTYFQARGAEYSALGYPIGPEKSTVGGGSVQDFQYGALYWSAASGTHMTMAGFRAAHAQRGWELGWLGMPITDEQWNGVGTVQHFQGGTMYYDALGVTVTKGVKAMEWAITQIGKPYATGGVGPNAYDCSGLTQSAFGSVGVAIPRTSFSQPAAGIPVPFNSLQPGDLVFSYGYGHVAIYVGDGKVVNALNYGTPVSITPLYGGFNGAVRVLS